MKRILFCVMLLATAAIAFSHDYLLMPDEFFLAKGQALNVHLLVSDNLTGLQEKKYESTKTSRFLLLSDGKKTDLKATATDSIQPILSVPMQTSGLAMVVLERSPSEITLDKAKFLEYLEEDGLIDMLKKAESIDKAQFKEKYTRYLKTLVSVDKPSGGYFSEKTGQELEIILLQNPYKMKYGDDIVAQVFFKGKPLVHAQLGVQVKGLNGNVFPQNYTTDRDGKIYFKLNRSGTWVVRMVHMQPSTDPAFDFESWWASYSFGFK